MSEILTHAVHDTANADLGAHQPKPTAVTEGLTEASATAYQAGRIATGLWECTPGTFTARRDGYTEICTILSGRVTIEVEGQDPEEFGPGDVMVMPSGWEGSWVVHEPLRKHFTTIDD